MDPLMASIQWVAFPFAPAGWATCDGQFLPVDQNNALFDLLGTTYGGDGIDTFALPDLRSTIAVGTGWSPSATTVLGQTGQILQPASAGVSPHGTLGMTAIVALQGIFPQQD